ncbi:hypothetical protein [Polaribacter sp.]|nr:hypothetical protein [Polaribacter sp.]
MELRLNKHIHLLVGIDVVAVPTGIIIASFVEVLNEDKSKNTTEISKIL